jgi:hypothetical protein
VGTFVNATMYPHQHSNFKKRKNIQNIVIKILHEYSNLIFIKFRTKIEAPLGIF